MKYLQLDGKQHTINQSTFLLVSETPNTESGVGFSGVPHPMLQKFLQFVTTGKKGPGTHVEQAVPVPAKLA